MGNVDYRPIMGASGIENPNRLMGSLTSTGEQKIKNDTFGRLM